MVNVKNEYSKLKEVIVGRVDNANMPRHGFDLHAINYADKDKIPFCTFVMGIVFTLIEK